MRAFLKKCMIRALVPVVLSFCLLNVRYILSLRQSVFKMAAPKLRILCLHGKQQNREVFRAKLGKIPRKLKDVAELTVLDAPFILEDQSTPDNLARTWFNREINGGPIDVVSLASALDGLATTWREQGPFDGILGFSMGGTMASIMASATCPVSESEGAAVIGSLDKPLFPGIRFIICAGAVDIPKEFAATLDQSHLPVKFPLAIPTHIQSLHIAGTGDTAVPISSSMALAARFTHSKFVEHGEGHHIPMKTPIIQAIDEFVKSQVLIP